MSDAPGSSKFERVWSVCSSDVCRAIGIVVERQPVEPPGRSRLASPRVPVAPRLLARRCLSMRRRPPSKQPTGVRFRTPVQGLVAPRLWWRREQGRWVRPSAGRMSGALARWRAADSDLPPLGCDPPCRTHSRPWQASPLEVLVATQARRPALDWRTWRRCTVGESGGLRRELPCSGRPFRAITPRHLPGLDGRDGRARIRGLLSRLEAVRWRCRESKARPQAPGRGHIHRARDQRLEVGVAGADAPSWRTESPSRRRGRSPGEVTRYRVSGPEADGGSEGVRRPASAFLRPVTVLATGVQASGLSQLPDFGDWARQLFLATPLT